MSRANLLDIAKLTGNDKVVGLIEENLKFVPEVALFQARTIKGTGFTTTIRTGFPSVGFRAANEGVTPSKSTLTNRLVQCFIMGGRIECDLAVAQAHEDGPQAYEMMEALGVTKQAMIELGSQIFYGITADSKGFPGLKAAIPFGSELTVNAGGTTNSTATSVYAVKFGIQDTQLLFGNGNVLKLGDFRDETIYDDNDNPLPGRVADLCGWAGLQIGNGNCVGRILNITADSGKGMTDTLTSQLLEKFPVGFTPDVLFMNRRSAGQLSRSRTVVINAGATGKLKGDEGNVAPFPTHSCGIPVCVTDSILSTDALES